MKEDEWEKQESGAYWKPTEKGEQIEGEIIDEGKGQYGQYWSIKRADGEIITTPSYKALQSRMANAKVGDMVRIRFMGEDLPKVKGYKPTNLFEVFIKKK